MKFLLRGGMVVDGTGAAPLRADVLTDGERIAAIRPDIVCADADVLDVSGKYVCPGFINAHSHADCSVAMCPDMESSLGQGITTEFAGHCGLGVAPVQDNWIYMFPEKRAFTGVIPEPIGGINPYGFYWVPTDKIAEAFPNAYGEELDWRSYGEFLDHLRRRGTGTNMALVVGQANLRFQAMGTDFRRDASEREMREMERMLSEAMDCGARGIGLGLDYQPGLFASHEELVRLSRIAAERNGMVTAHVRSRSHDYYGREITFGDGLREFLNLGLESGARLHVCHIQNAFGTDSADKATVYRQVDDTLRLLDEYRSRGVRVTWDVIPAHLFGPFHYPMAASLFQPYIEHCGGVENFARYLHIGNYRNMIEEEIRKGNHASRGIFTRFDPVRNPQWANGYVITRSSDPSLKGSTIAEAAGKEEALRFLLEVLAEDPFMCVMPLSRRPLAAYDRDRFVSRAEACIGLDVWSLNYAEALNVPGMPLECGSPATYCGMTEFLYDQKSNPIEETIRKLSGNPAQILRLEDRGLLKEGYFADIVVLDPRRLDGNEHPDDPRVPPQGIESVFVNGAPAVHEGIQNHVRTGKVI